MPDQDDDRAIASRVAARAQLRDIRGVSVEADLVGEREHGRQLTYSLKTEVDVAYPHDEDFDIFTTSVTFDLTLSMAPDPDAEHDEEAESPREDPARGEDPDLLAHVIFEQQALFTLEMRADDDPVTEEEMDAFGKTTGLFALYPFAREWAHDLTGRLGLPPLTLPTMHLPHDGPKSHQR